ncbi:MAG: hypothetical protein KDC67_13035, partial [Ignavibacteriae bacterium]|nr:hypothetical protein [Ignavibacteriota bacterium]
MSLLIVFVTTILGMILGKMIFKNWVNHLTMYSIIMGGLTFLYELKLLAYPDIIPLAWFFLFASFLSFVLGIITFLSAKNLNPKWSINLPKTDLALPIFADKGKMLKYSVIFFSLIGLFVALQRWYVLIGMFGSIEAVLLKAAVIYRMNVNGEIKEFIPILPAFIYVGVFLSGVYTAYRGKFSFLSFFPILCIILKELTYFGRGEMFFSTMQFLVTFFLFKNLLNNKKKK